LRSIEKRFGGPPVLGGVDLELRAGVVHALAGENGAGKSTLLKLIAGVYRPDGGTIEFEGKRVTFATPRAALDAGISMIHQELTPLRDLPVYENLFLGSELGRAGFVDRRLMIERSRELLGELELDVDPRTLAGELSTAQLQLLEIVKAVAVRSVSVVLMDEPTSSLNSSEIERLFRLVRRLRERGIAVAFTTHKMEELYAMADEVSVLRDGKLIAKEPTSSLDEERLIKLMVGRDIRDFYDYADAHTEGIAPGTVPAFSVCGLSRTGDFQDVSFDLMPGEIVGMAGLLGSGRSELLETVFGLRRATAGSVEFNGIRTTVRAPRDAMRCGVAFIGEDRRRSGIVPQLGVRENLSLRSLARFSSGGFVDKRSERHAAATMVEQLAVRADSLEQPVETLSGGNQQKIVIGKWLLSEPAPKIYLLVEPTRGIDVGAKAYIYALLRRLASEGAAILFVSGELPEIMNLSDRVIVMRKGRVVGILSRERFSQEAIMTLAAASDAA